MDGDVSEQQQEPTPGIEQMLPAAAIMASFVEALQAVGFERSHAVELTAAFFQGSATSHIGGHE